MFKKILIANRGEIALRIMRTCREMEISTVAVYSEADRSALHVRYADEAYYIGPSPSTESYLVIENIIKAARKSKAEAIHPGYGFLSENAEFAKRCLREGLVFIGPSPHSISTMGDKITARRTVINAGIPVVPGTNKEILKEKVLSKIVNEIGLPVMIKASAGGGGKGIRLVHHEKELSSAIRAAKSEALAAFGDDSVYIEKYITSPHHIEFQILADKHGNTVHICERECSVQRRHQKIVEESPSPLVTPVLRKKMGEAAVKAAKAVEYEGAGTIEFLVDDDRNFYFLEMNTRLQVEHPITEMVVGIDLVKAQIQIAAGEKLMYKQSDIKQLGHAIECRIYAEDPSRNFMPAPGIVKHITEPGGLGVRIDGYVYEGYEIPIFYDPMISKLITWGIRREDAIDRMKRALYEYKISGIKTSIPFLKNIMNSAKFVAGNYNTHFIGDNWDELLKPGNECGAVCEDISVIAVFFDFMNKIKKLSPVDSAKIETNGWKDFGRRKGIMRF
jgi:acetyl-CoA carboxylase biotin carboxylase subunit